MLEYGFDAVGGFYVIDHALRTAEYAYPSSPWATRAKRALQSVLDAMLEQLAHNRKHGCPEIIERHYLAICRHEVGGHSERVEPVPQQGWVRHDAPSNSGEVY